VPYRDLIRRLFWPTLGNRDVVTSRGSPGATWTPANNAAGSENTSFDVGNAHRVLDSNADTAPGVPVPSATSTWPRARLEFVASITPSTRAARSGSEPGFGRLCPVRSPHVDIVFNGHNHIYERTQPLRAGSRRWRDDLPDTGGGA
jgi:hypothetical protein